MNETTGAALFIGAVLAVMVGLAVLGWWTSRPYQRNDCQVCWRMDLFRRSVETMARVIGSALIPVLQKAAASMAEMQRAFAALAEILKRETAS